MITNILGIKNVCKEYSSFKLDNISFEIPTGYIMGFIGPNGAGKTTTIKSMLNMIAIDSGEINMFGCSLADSSQKIKNDIGVVMDNPFFVDLWKVGDVEKVISPFYSSWQHDTFEKYLKEFSLNKNKKVKELSRGMKVKLMLAVALSHDAKLLILDEPTSGLDPVARDELMDILGDFISDENRSVLFSTHITSDLEKIADYITFIINGKIEYTGEKDQLLDTFLLVKGNSSSLSVEQKKLIIGYREHSVGYEGMIKSSDKALVPDDTLCEKPTLDEIIVFINKEAKNNE